ncbi:uncharacterized protein [Mytilus edulis]|uniref:uncharacterized protein isoform X1 n=1 Tax=Mytilus edulis TaxID=6550 RepID=UPI0039F0E48C
MKNKWMNTYVMYIWIYLTFTRILFQRFIKGQQGLHFAMIELTWENAYDYCALRGQRLVYSMEDFPVVQQIDLQEVLAESNISLQNIWTIHKVNNETPKATRSTDNFPSTIGYNLSDLESVLCVYLVYEDLTLRGWEADECKNETVVHYPLCDDSVHASMEITLYQEKVDWKEAKSYCEYKSSALINLDSSFNYVRLFAASTFELNLKRFELNQSRFTIFEVLFWVEPLKYPDAVVEETMCDYGVVLPPPFGFYYMERDRESCTKPLHYIMCIKQTEKISFVQVTYNVTNDVLLLTSIIASRPAECEEHCIAIIKYGIDCDGFNFNRTSHECLFLAVPYEFYLYESRNPAVFVSYKYEITDEMLVFLVTYGKVTIGEYKLMNEDESREFQIQNHYNTASTVGKTITQTKLTSTGVNAEGRLLTITMGVVGAVASFILLFTVVSIVHKVQYMESSLAGENKSTRKEAEEQLRDSFTIELPDDDGESILTKGVNTRNIPPTFYMDIIE